MGGGYEREWSTPSLNRDKKEGVSTAEAGCELGKTIRQELVEKNWGGGAVISQGYFS